MNVLQFHRRPVPLPRVRTMVETGGLETFRRPPHPRPTRIYA